MAKKRAKARRQQKPATTAKKRKTSTTARKRTAKTTPRKDQTLELNLPDTLYAAAADMDQETLVSILEAVLGGEERFGIKKVVINPKSRRIATVQMKSFAKPC